MDIKKQKDIIVEWLKDAYAMERALEETLTTFASESEEYPMVKEKLEEHAKVTKEQAERLKTHLEGMGEDTSAIKNLSGEIMGRLQGNETRLANDRIIKNTLMGFASEYFEIACYQALAAAAEKCEDTETADLARQHMEEEQEMADWAEENLPGLVEEFLGKEEE